MIESITKQITIIIIWPSLQQLWLLWIGIGVGVVWLLGLMVVVVELLKLEVV